LYQRYAEGALQLRGVFLAGLILQKTSTTVPYTLTQLSPSDFIYSMFLSCLRGIQLLPFQKSIRISV